MKSKLPVIVAVALAVVAVIAVRSYVNNIQSQSQKQLQGDKYLVAATDIEAGAAILYEQISTRAVPKRFVPPLAIPGKKENALLISGRITKMPLRPGELIMWNDLISEKRGGFQSLIPVGERAFEVKLGSGINPALVQAGDRVDILATFALPESNKEKTGVAPAADWRSRSDMVNIVLLQNVAVLAVGRSFGDLAAASDAKELTLAVTLQEAQLLMFATEHGDLAAVLRKDEDVATVPRSDLPRVTFQQLETLVGDLDALRTRRTVQVLKGGRIEEVSVEDGGAGQ
jgi:Flp pilus assembly protein CpaB